MSIGGGNSPAGGGNPPAGGGNPPAGGGNPLGLPVTACLFPGQGSQAVGMGKALADQFPICAAVFAEADAALGESLSGLIFNGPADQLQLTANTQPAILTMSVAVWRLLAERGLQPAFVAGHSLGEYSAHVAAGTLAFADAVRLVRNRGTYMPVSYTHLTLPTTPYV